MDRRRSLKIFSGSALTTAAVMTGCKSKTETKATSEYAKQVEPPIGKMTYRTSPTTGDKVSLLGYGMMRLPSKTENKDDYDQEMVNRQVDYAIEHGVNYFDTSPVYCQGKSEACTGIALSRHKRSEYFIATKLSNFNPATQSREASIQMYKNSMKELQVDYIDYYLLHSIGGGGMEAFKTRYIDNGMLDFCIEERKAGRIRNLGFSYHGDIAVFDWLLSMHDQYKWDFVQIELNYLDWDYANEINSRNTDARYLYAELKKRNIPAVIMEPLLGGRLANLPQYLVTELKQRDPERSVASWAFRYAGTPEGVHGAPEGQPAHLQSAQAAHCRGARVPAEGCCRAHRRTGEHPLHRLQILHAVPLRHQHPRHLCPLQQVQERGHPASRPRRQGVYGAAPSLPHRARPLGSQTTPGRPLHRLWPV